LGLGEGIEEEEKGEGRRVWGWKRTIITARGGTVMVLVFYSVGGLERRHTEAVDKEEEDTVDHLD